MHNITAPANDDASIERLIQSKGKVAARVTPAVIEKTIVAEAYFTAAEGIKGRFPDHVPDRQVEAPLGLLTFCVLILANGFTVTGESACASPENFDDEIGKRIAKENAVQKMWPLLGYELKSRLAAEHKAEQRQLAEAAWDHAYPGIPYGQKTNPGLVAG